MQVELERVKAIFAEALRRDDEAARADYLNEACGGDTELRRQVDALLAAHEGAGSFLKLPREATISFLELREKAGHKIGPYKLLQQIGEGGMGVVFMAEQLEPVQRTVAIKIIKPGMDTRQVIVRFEVERQALALMDHPNIARVLDAGTTDTGRPYFVMDVVKGVPITEYCDQQHLAVRARLELMATVCHAVQHAHQKGIIHRDLKPSNVLVAEYDGKPVPKIIDFGVAKATAQKLTDKTMFTEYGQLIGTFEYMSPEQARFNQLDVDTRSDIYSLGVLLYELLAGSTPLEKERLRSAAVDEILQMIGEEEPPAPSTRLSSSQTLPAISAQRHSEPAKLKKLVRGELDWIVMKCLEKDRNRRYETASELATDIGRYLADEPVAAKPATQIYKLKKFVRRNKVGVFAGAAVLTALIAGLTLASLGLVQARRQAVRADAEALQSSLQAARSNQISGFLKQVLKATGATDTARREPQFLREALGDTSRRIKHDLELQPDVQGDLWMTLGDTFTTAGDYPSAIEMYQHAVDKFQQSQGGKSEKLAEALGHLGYAQSSNRNVSEGKSNAYRGLNLAREIGEPETLATCLTDAARSLSFGRFVSRDGEPLLREALAIRRQLGSNPAELADCAFWLAGSLENSDGPEKESLVREALALHSEFHGPDHPSTADDLVLLGSILLKAKKLEEAKQILGRAVELYQNNLHYDHPNQPVVLRLLVNTMLLRRETDDGELILLRAVKSHPSNAMYRSVLAGFYSHGGNWAEAAKHLSLAVDLDMGNEDSLFFLAIALLQAGEVQKYRHHCHVFLEQAADSHETHEIDMAAKAALLLPVEGADFERACELADSTVESSDVSDIVSWFYLCKSLADYRRGQFELAMSWSSRAIAHEQTEPQCQAACSFIQAATLAKLHDLNAAHAAFAHGDEIMSHRESIELDPLGTWQDWEIAAILRREAAELLGVSEPQPDVESDLSGSVPVRAQ